MKQKILLKQFFSLSILFAFQYKTLFSNDSICHFRKCYCCIFYSHTFCLSFSVYFLLLSQHFSSIFIFSLSFCFVMEYTALRVKSITILISVKPTTFSLLLVLVEVLLYFWRSVFPFKANSFVSNKKLRRRINH